MYAFTNGTIFTGMEILEDSAVIIDDKRISDVVKTNAIPKQAEVIDLQKNILAPGFIDLQLNGCGGRFFNDDISTETLDIMSRAILSTGCTSFLPTLVSAPEEDMIKSLHVVKKYREENGKAVLGLHLEGPYLSHKRRGIHNPYMISKPNDKVVSLIAEFGPEVTRICTMAPENIEARHVQELENAGIRVSAGHSAASCPRAREMFRAGISMATHLFNGMEPLQGREPSLVGAIYLEKPWTGIITDGVHVSWDNVELARNILGNRLFCITDATSAIVSDLTEFVLGGQTVYVNDGKCAAADGTIGGSMLTMDKAVYNCVNHVGIELAEALRMTSLYPARAIRVDDEYGIIASGYHADLVIMDHGSLKVRSVMKGGKLHNFDRP
ncbi:N-acetylglucosamine-6-phosphate deacetylase [Maridesulfovibrio hydrothermalis]|uniref:N-acetylglucosamine-6-phosphate deacetylase n=1 Tax=Maridesulfovibrio hydrothermalis AM13 = DSM 14728 TaxID=1121451 RepID=L0RB40_9BACT|nr:N-acetylglucosamine-6-phosphate deacetylase [Maridesulfovibrio hydrothermalis]CCO23400.1 N-acetylglucosamine-6-phosphate deacetylase [Maridesulfovibrio hydrothermalis AM13 = DSM 14728]